MINRFCARTCFVFYSLLFFVGFTTPIKAQCSGCTTVITSNSSANITLGSADVLCIKAGVTYSGKITLNGGILCNQGTVNNIVFISGTFNNYNTFNKSIGGLSITKATNLFINCYEGSSFIAANGISISALTANDSMAIYISEGSKFSIGGGFSISNGILNLNNGVVFKGSKSPSPSIFNVGGGFSATNAQLKLTNQSFGIFNITKAFNLVGSSNKIITNYGTVNSNAALNISGDGGGTSSTVINNFASFNITNSLNSIYSNGTVTINNNQWKPQSTFVVGKSLYLKQTNNSFYNYSSLTLVNDLVNHLGFFFNNGTLNCRDINIQSSTVKNNSKINSSRNVTVSNGGNLINNGQLFVANNFDNTALVNFGQASVLLTNNFSNLGSGEIDGPLTLSGAAGPDSTNYAFIDIINNSNNNAFLKNYLFIYDETFSGTGIRLDNYHNNVARLGIPPVIIGIPHCFLSVFAVNLSPASSTLCNGAATVLTATAYNIYSLSPAPVASYIWASPSLTTTPPTNTINIGPITGNTTYTVTIKLSNGCLKTTTATVNLSTLFANAGIDRSITTGTTTQIGGLPAPLGGTVATASGGLPPYTYTWSPNTSLTSTNVANPIASPSVSISYSVKVTDAMGCKAQDFVVVAIQNNNEYVELHKKLDGSFYAIKNNTLFFTLKGDYSQMNLKFNVFDFKRTDVTGSTVINNSSLKNGDNRYALTVTSLINGYYVLEVNNQKNEKLFLRFKR